ncbi:dienelactone hydrolase family protein [Bacillus anthracis]|uniref:alpha/beta hydrolase n=1 Tax=Bacillus anthracis TaxID=1392 RepID=UPI002DB875F9|nr:hypothetical protein [Bacillus anthracis]MEB9507350.1 dienelactone hydrolase family protein [Bacillus anthracis]
MEVHTSQAEDLASNGYIVVAIDHTYVSAATAFPEKMVSHHDATTDFNTPEPAEVITEIMADDIKFVVDKLSEINAGEEEYQTFKNKFDLEKIGVIGHSLGGAVAYDLAMNHDRNYVSINLDGRVFVSPEKNKQNLETYLMLVNDKYHIQGFENKTGILKDFDDMTPDEQQNSLLMHGSREAYDEAYSKAQQNLLELSKILKETGNLYSIEGSDHMGFTDISYFVKNKRMQDLLGIGGNTTPTKSLEITKAITLVFFDQHLKNKTDVSLEVLMNKYPELNQANIK